MAFRGTATYSLDEKNRLTVPARHRAALASGVVMAKGVERCVELWAPDDYAGFTAEALAPYPRLSPQGRKLRLFFSANSHDTEIDKAGRVQLPSFLIEHAGLDKEVVVLGGDDCLQVWDRKAWQDFNATLTDEVIEITSHLDDAA